MRNIAIALLTILLSNAAYGTEKTIPFVTEVSCSDERVSACEDALDRGDKVINEQAQTIQLLDAQKDRLQKSLDYEINELAKETAWYRDPKVIGPVAFLAGLTVGLLGFKGR